MPAKRKEILSSPQRVKKPKRDLAAEKLNEQLGEVVAALHQVDVSGEVAKMLSSVVPLSLGELSEQRHPFQKRVVEGIASLLLDAEAALKKEVADNRATRDEAAVDKPTREKAAVDAEEKLNSKIAEVQSAKVALAGKAMAFRAARTALAEAEQAKVLDGQVAQDAEKKKSDFVAALEDLTALKSAPAQDAEGRKRNSELMSLLKKHKFEESMMIALPAALAKAPEARGQFDSMVIGQLEAELAKNISEQDKILADAVPGQEKCTSAIKQAQDAFDAARGEQRSSAKIFDTLSKEQADLTEASAGAQKAVRDIVTVLKKHDKALHNAEVEVEIFEQGPRETFKALCERTTPPPVVEDEDDAAAPMEEVEVPVVA
jgi:hypothetical protein